MSDDAAPETQDRTCSECKEQFDAVDPLTVQWANVVFCSELCRDRWTSKQRGAKR